MDARGRVVLLGAIALGAAIRFATLDLQSYHHDEAVTAVRVLAGDFGEVLEQLTSSERSGPVYYVTAWLWAQPFGTGEVGLRALSAIVGTLTIPAAYFAGRALASRRAGQLAAVLVALCPVLVWYSQEARSYGTMVLFAILALGFMAKATREVGARAPVLWALCGALAFASHYFAIFVVAPQAAWLLLRGADRRWTRIATAGLALAVVALGLLAAEQQSGRSSEGVFTERGLANRLAETFVRFATFEEPGLLAGSPAADLVQVGGTVAVWAVIALAIAWGVRRAAAHREAVAVAAGIGALGVAVPFAAALAGQDFFNPRNMLASMAMALLAASVAIAAAGSPEAPPRERRAARVGAGALLAAFAGLLVVMVASAQFQRDDWREAAAAIGPPDGPRVVVVNVNGDDPLLYYLGAERFEQDTYPGGARVSEFVTLSKSPNVRPPDPRFELVEKRGLAPNFILQRFRVSAPVAVSSAKLRNERILLDEKARGLIDGT